MMTTATLFVRREVATALRTRWFLIYSAIFLVSGILLVSLGNLNVALYGYRGFAKAFAGLVHLAMLFVPVMALLPATATIAEERESGALEYLLAQPVSFGQVFFGKWAGVSVAVLLALIVGFAAAGAVAVLRGVPPALIITLFGFVILLALAFVALGLCISAIASARAQAVTWGLIAWLALVVLSGLGVLVAFVRWGISERLLVLWTFINPTEAFRIGIVTVLDPDLSLLGPLGASIVERLGAGGTVALTGLTLTAWIVLPGLVGWLVFRRAR